MVDAKWDAMTCVQVKRRASIVEVRLNRPRKMNAINSTMEKEFYSVLADCDRMDDVKCVVLTAEGANFSSGHDVQQVAAETIGGQEPATIQDKYWVHTGDLLPPWRFSKGLVVAAKGYVGPHANTFLARRRHRHRCGQHALQLGRIPGRRRGTLRPLCADALPLPHPSHEAVVDDGRLDGCGDCRQLFYVNQSRRARPGGRDWRCVSPSRSRGWRPATSLPTSGHPPPL